MLTADVQPGNKLNLCGKEFFFFFLKQLRLTVIPHRKPVQKVLIDLNTLHTHNPGLPGSVLQSENNGGKTKILSLWNSKK